MQCLFAYQWHESGIHWALNYLYKRLGDIKKDVHSRQHLKQRSLSVPNMKQIFNNPVVDTSSVTKSSTNVTPFQYGGKLYFRLTSISISKILK